MAKVKWTLGALDDLDEIAEFIAREDPAAAERFVQRVWERTRKLEQLPRTGVLVRKQSGREVRQVWVTAYKIGYRITVQGTQECVEVLGVEHGRRRYRKW